MFFVYLHSRKNTFSSSNNENTCQTKWKSISKVFKILNKAKLLAGEFQFANATNFRTSITDRTHNPTPSLISNSIKAS